MEIYMIILMILAPIALTTLFLSFYCIIFNSPRGMTNDYKIYSALQCAVSSFFSFSMSSGSIPVAIPHCFGGYPLGFYKHLGISTAAQFFLHVSLINVYSGANVKLFYLRFVALQSKDNIFKYKFVRILAFIKWIFCYFSTITIIEVILLFTFENVKSSCLMVYDGDPYDVLREDTIIISFFHSGLWCTIYLFATLSILFIYTGHLFFLGFFTYRGLQEIKTRMSKKTVARHSNFIKVLYTQTFIHMVGFSLPAFLFFLLPFFKINIEGSLNICMGVVILTSILSPSYVFYNISSYNKAIRGIFRFSRKELPSAATINVRVLSRSSYG